MRAFVALAALATLALPAAALTTAPAGVVVAAGPVHHTLSAAEGTNEALIYGTLYGEPACAGEGGATVEVNNALRRMLLVNLDTGCLPGFSEISAGCSVAADGTAGCVRDVGANHIRMSLALDGAFLFTWDAPTFQERIEGTLVRS